MPNWTRFHIRFEEYKKKLVELNDEIREAKQKIKSMRKLGSNLEADDELYRYQIPRIEQRISIAEQKKKDCLDQLEVCGRWKRAMEPRQGGNR